MMPGSTESSGARKAAAKKAPAAKQAAGAKKAAAGEKEGAAKKAPSADPVAAAVDAVSESMREWVGAAKSSFDKAITGRYTTEDLAGDVAGMAARTVRDWARMLTAAASVASSLATTPMKPQPPAGGATATGATPGAKPSTGSGT